MNANLFARKIEMTKTEAKAAGKINSEKFNELHTLRTMYPTFEIVIKASAAKTLEEALNVAINGTTVEKYIAEQCAAIGENMKLRKFARYTMSGEGSIVSYIHMGGKVGVLLQVACGKAETVSAAEFQAMCKDITLHIAACAPKSVDASSLDPAFVAEEQEIAKAQLIAEGKPEALLEKILPGKLKALYKQSCLMSQEFVKDPSVSVEQLVAKLGKELGDTITVVSFERFQLGA